MTAPRLDAPAEHAAGCTYGGFSCGYWLVADGCPDYHPETHIVRDDRCPCGHEFPGAGTGKVVSDAEDRVLPTELQGGIGSPVEREVWRLSAPVGVAEIEAE